MQCGCAMLENCLWKLFLKNCCWNMFFGEIFPFSCCCLENAFWKIVAGKLLQHVFFIFMLFSSHSQGMSSSFGCDKACCLTLNGIPRGPPTSPSERLLLLYSLRPKIFRASLLCWLRSHRRVLVAELESELEQESELE